MDSPVYGLDPVLVADGQIATRSTPDPNVLVGLGSPRLFPFNQGPLDNPLWWAEPTQMGGSIWGGTDALWIQQAYSGSAGSWVRAATAGAFDLANLVSIGFTLRAQNFDSVSAALLQLAGGLTLEFLDNGRSAQWVNPLDDYAVLGRSTIRADGHPVDILMVMTSERVVVWEDGTQVLSIYGNFGNAGETLPGQATGNAVRATFFLTAQDGNARIAIGVSNLAVTAATQEPVPLKTQPVIPPRNTVGPTDDASASTPSSWTTLFNQLLPIAQTLDGAGAPLRAALQVIGDNHIGAWATMFGYTPDSSTITLAAQFLRQPQVQQFVTTASRFHATQSAERGVNTGSTFFVGIGMNAGYFIAGGYQLGFLFDISKSPVQTALVLVVGLGGGIDIGVAGHFDIGFVPLSIDDILGWGASIGIDGGEVVVVSFGISGNIPLHLRTWDNCGPALNLGVGVGLPLEAVGLVTRTILLSRW